MKDSAEKEPGAGGRFRGLQGPGLGSIRRMRPGRGLTNYLRSCLNPGLNVLGGGEWSGTIHIFLKCEKADDKKKKKSNDFNYIKNSSRLAHVNINRFLEEDYVLFPFQ